MLVGRNLMKLQLHRDIGSVRSGRRFSSDFFLPCLCFTSQFYTKINPNFCLMQKFGFILLGEALSSKIELFTSSRVTSWSPSL